MALDIYNLLRALPVSEIYTNSIASISGLIHESMAIEMRDGCLRLLEPPAGQQAPYVDLDLMLKILYPHARLDSIGQFEKIKAMSQKIKDSLPSEQKVHFLTSSRFYQSDIPKDPYRMVAPLGVPAYVVVEHLQKEGLVPSQILDFIANSLTSLSEMRCLHWSEHSDKRFGLDQLAVMPAPWAMMEEFIRVQRHVCWHIQADRPYRCLMEMLSPYVQWREAIMPQVKRLEDELGQELYYFAPLDLDDADDDDNDVCHRFLALHYFCSLMPEHPFTLFLIERSGANDVQELKAELLLAENYRLVPFESPRKDHKFLESNAFFDYPANTRRSIGVVWADNQSVEIIKEVLLNQVGAHVHLVYPKNESTQPWLAKATRFCGAVQEHTHLDSPISFLAMLDELIVVAEDEGGADIYDDKIPYAIKHLLWLAHHMELPYSFCYSEEWCGWAVQHYFDHWSDVDAMKQALLHRQTFTKSLNEVRVINKLGGSGLLDANGHSLRFDFLDLSFELMRRIYLWQQDYENIQALAPINRDAHWISKHQAEQCNIAAQLQNFLSSTTKVIGGPT